MRFKTREELETAIEDMKENDQEAKENWNRLTEIMFEQSKRLNLIQTAQNGNRINAISK